MKVNAKLVAKVAILTAVTIGTFLAATVQQVPSADGGPIILCQPGGTKCTYLPTVRS